MDSDKLEVMRSACCLFCCVCFQCFSRAYCLLQGQGGALQRQIPYSFFPRQDQFGHLGSFQIWIVILWRTRESSAGTGNRDRTGGIGNWKLIFTLLYTFCIFFSTFSFFFFSLSIVVTSFTCCEARQMLRESNSVPPGVSLLI